MKNNLFNLESLNLFPDTFLGVAQVLRNDNNYFYLSHRKIYDEHFQLNYVSIYLYREYNK